MRYLFIGGPWNNETKNFGGHEPLRVVQYIRQEVMERSWFVDGPPACYGTGYYRVHPMSKEDGRRGKYGMRLRSLEVTVYIDETKTDEEGDLAIQSLWPDHADYYIPGFNIEGFDLHCRLRWALRKRQKATKNER